MLMLGSHATTKVTIRVALKEMRVGCWVSMSSELQAQPLAS